MPRKRSGRFTYIRAEADEDLAPAAAPAEAERRHRRSSSCAGAGRARPRGSRAARGARRRGCAGARRAHASPSRPRRRRSRWRRCLRSTARRHRVAPRPPALRPADRLGPLGLEVRPGRAVVERLLELAPAALEADPRERLARRGRVARDRDHRRAQVDVRAAGVVAADALLGRAADVQRLVEEVRVRARGREDDRARTPTRCELVVAPVRALGALVLAVADLDGLARRAPPSRRRRRRRAGSSPSRPRAGCSSRCRRRRASTAARACPAGRPRWRRARTPSAALPSVMRRAQRS